VAVQQITKVHTVRPAGASHEHIEQVELNGSIGQRISRQVVIANLRSPYGDRYYTLGGGKRAQVIVSHCPHCGRSDYVTTAPDTTRENNLLHLQRF
jgi:Protein of unknown function (DUF3892)